MNTKTETQLPDKGQGKTPATRYKAPILNPAWAEEVVKNQGLNGPLAKAMAADLADEVTKSLTKFMTEERITKMLKKSFGVKVGKVKAVKQEE